MTEKRFTSQDVYNGINEFHQVYDNHKRISNEEVVELLNALHEKNTRLRNEIQDFQNLLTEREETFLKPIHLALDDAIENERTALGKSALKQFKQTIME